MKMVVFFLSVLEAISNKAHRCERSKDATNAAPGLTTRNKKLLVTKALGVIPSILAFSHAASLLQKAGYHWFSTYPGQYRVVGTKLGSSICHLILIDYKSLPKFNEVSFPNAWQ